MVEVVGHVLGFDLRASLEAALRYPERVLRHADRMRPMKRLLDSDSRGVEA